MGGALLVGDVGGTNARFGMATRREGVISIDGFESLPGKQFKTFDEALQGYFDKTGVTPDAACIAVAGPVRDGRAELTNRGWTVSERGLSERFGIRKPLVVNDFLAMARSVPEVGPEAFDEIFPGVPVEGAPILVAGPGTGFGVATLLRGQGGWIVMAGEGGHMAYAPRTDFEREILKLLARDHGYVSNELVASGSGLSALHAVVCEIYGVPVVDVEPDDMETHADAGEEMYTALLNVRALATMGAVGDLALANGALGGVVLAGGVSGHIVEFLVTEESRERFVARGPMSDYLANCPVRLLKEPAAALIGAAAHYEQVCGPNS